MNPADQNEFDSHHPEVDYDRVAQIEDRMRAEGVPTTERVQVDYFDFDVTHTTLLPDGISFVQHRELNEGERTRYLKVSNRDVRLQKVTGDAIISMSPGEERKALLTSAVVGWNLVKGGQPLAFTKTNLEKWLTVAPPAVIDIVEKDVRKANPWLLAEVSVADLDKEIETLTELRATKLEEEAGKAA